MSEWSNIVKIWANVFETTFEQTVTKGLRAVFKQIILVAPGAYFVRKYDHTVVHPPNPTKIKQFQLDDLKQLFFLVVKEAERTNEVLLQDDYSFGSQSTIEDQQFVKAVYTLAKSPKKFTALPAGFFKNM
ncbi:hypothetical protein CU098_009171 [Rhizopus stolonifer]|uniref:Uncharacterized protein n=1 Tax=Rhizopus stolonifer TaxID=4846 RepID=A0A367JES4_RHIST|nr:hypothetical protein CU098_009171 [Rhizopus stolonifer]